MFQEYELLREWNNELDVDENKMDSEEIGDANDIPTLVEGDNAEKHVCPLHTLMNYVHTSAEFDAPAKEMSTVRLRDFLS